MSAGIVMAIEIEKIRSYSNSAFVLTSALAATVIGWRRKFKLQFHCCAGCLIQ